MAVQFQYTARQGGQIVRGKLTADSTDDAVRQLRQQSLFPVKVERASSLGEWKLAPKRVSSGLLVRFYGQMSDLLRAGVPLLASLSLLARQSTNPRMTEVISDIRQRVADGEGIAEAMAIHQAVFGELAISMVRAGQEGGFLEDVFKRISIFTERQEELRGKVMGAMAYPIFLSGVGGLVVLTLIVYFVPKFGRIFDRLRARGEMPAATEWLLAFSNFLQSYGILVAIALAGLGYYLFQLSKTPKGRRFVDTWKLRIPMAGPIFRDLALTRFNRVLGTLRKNGVPILPALRIAKDSTGNVLMREAIDRAAENVQAGDKLATPLRASGCIPPDIVAMIEVAEESNSLETVLLESADSLETRTTRQLELAVRFLEPLLLMIMAGITLLVVIALLLPIFRMSSTVG